MPSGLASGLASGFLSDFNNNNDNNNSFSQPFNNNFSSNNNSFSSPFSSSFTNNDSSFSNNMAQGFNPNYASSFVNNNYDPSNYVNNSFPTFSNTPANYSNNASLFSSPAFTSPFRVSSPTQVTGSPIAAPFNHVIPQAGPGISTGSQNSTPNGINQIMGSDPFTPYYHPYESPDLHNGNMPQIRPDNSGPSLFNGNMPQMRPDGIGNTMGATPFGRMTDSSNSGFTQPFSSMFTTPAQVASRMDPANMTNTPAYMQNNYINSNNPYGVGNNSGNPFNTPRNTSSSSTISYSPMDAMNEPFRNGGYQNQNQSSFNQSAYDAFHSTFNPHLSNANIQVPAPRAPTSGTPVYDPSSSELVATNGRDYLNSLATHTPSNILLSAVGAPGVYFPNGSYMGTPGSSPTITTGGIDKYKAAAANPMDSTALNNYISLDTGIQRQTPAGVGAPAGAAYGYELPLLHNYAANNPGNQQALQTTENATRFYNDAFPTVPIGQSYAHWYGQPVASNSGRSGSGTGGNSGGGGSGLFSVIPDAPALTSAPKPGDPGFIPVGGLPSWKTNPADTGPNVPMQKQNVGPDMILPNWMTSEYPLANMVKGMQPGQVQDNSAGSSGIPFGENLGLDQLKLMGSGAETYGQVDINNPQNWADHVDYTSSGGGNGISSGPNEFNNQQQTAVNNALSIFGNEGYIHGVSLPLIINGEGGKLDISGRAFDSTDARGVTTGSSGGSPAISTIQGVGGLGYQNFMSEIAHEVVGHGILGRDHTSDPNSIMFANGSEGGWSPGQNEPADNNLGQYVWKELFTPSTFGATGYPNSTGSGVTTGVQGDPGSTTAPMGGPSTPTGSTPQQKPSGDKATSMFSSAMGGPPQSGPQQSGPQQSGPSGISPYETTPSKDSASSTGPQQSGPNQSGPQQSGPNQSGPTGSAPSNPYETTPTAQSASSSGPSGPSGPSAPSGYPSGPQGYPSGYPSPYGPSPYGASPYGYPMGPNGYPYPMPAMPQQNPANSRHINFFPSSSSAYQHGKQGRNDKQHRKPHNLNNYAAGGNVSSAGNNGNGLTFPSGEWWNNIAQNSNNDSSSSSPNSAGYKVGQTIQPAGYTNMSTGQGIPYGGYGSMGGYSSMGNYGSMGGYSSMGNYGMGGYGSGGMGDLGGLGGMAGSVGLTSAPGNNYNPNDSTQNTDSAYSNMPDYMGNSPWPSPDVTRNPLGPTPPQSSSPTYGLSVPPGTLPNMGGLYRPSFEDWHNWEGPAMKVNGYAPWQFAAALASGKLKVDMNNMPNQAAYPDITNWGGATHDWNGIGANSSSDSTGSKWIDAIGNVRDSSDTSGSGSSSSTDAASLGYTDPSQLQSFWNQYGGMGDLSGFGGFGGYGGYGLGSSFGYYGGYPGQGIYTNAGGDLSGFPYGGGLYSPATGGGSTSSTSGGDKTYGQGPDYYNNSGSDKFGAYGGWQGATNEQSLAGSKFGPSTWNAKGWYGGWGNDKNEDKAEAWLKSNWDNLWTNAYSNVWSNNPAQKNSSIPNAAHGKLISEGGHVPGQAQVEGDSEKNDTVKALLSPGEIVIPRSIAMSENAPEKSAQFVASVLARSSKGQGLASKRRK